MENLQSESWGRRIAAFVVLMGVSVAVGIAGCQGSEAIQAGEAVVVEVDAPAGGSVETGELP